MNEMNETMRIKNILIFASYKENYWEISIWSI